MDDIQKRARIVLVLVMVVVVLSAATIFLRSTSVTDADMVDANTADATIDDGMMQPMTQDTLTQTLNSLGVAVTAEPNDAEVSAILTSMDTAAEETAQVQAQADAGADASNAVAQDGLKRWEKNKTSLTVDPSKPMVIIIIDDVGVTKVRSHRVLNELPAEVTLSFLPYGDSTEELVQVALKKKHDIMIHLPMEPKKTKEGKSIYPGEDALYVDLPLDKVRELTRKNLDSLKDVAMGVNNHMGSRFTEYSDGMKIVLDEVDKDELMFLDSLTSGRSVGSKLAKAHPDMPFMKRDFFIDHFQEEEKIMTYLHKLEERAKVRGYAIGIGHPHNVTTDALKKWIPTLKEKGIQLAPVSALLQGETL